MKNLKLLGRILYALPFGIFGLNHFLMVDYYTQMIASSPVKFGGGFTVMLAGFAMILIAFLIIIKKFVKESAIALAVLLAIFILTIHIPNLFVPENFNVSMVNLLKDTSLLGGTLLIISTCGNKIETS